MLGCTYTTQSIAHSTTPAALGVRVLAQHTLLPALLDRPRQSWRHSSTARSATVKAQLAAPWTGRPTQVQLAAAICMQRNQQATVCAHMRILPVPASCLSPRHNVACAVCCCLLRTLQAWCHVWRVARRSPPAYISSASRLTSITTGWMPVRKRTRSEGRGT